MIINELTPQGARTRELSNEEVLALALIGNKEAKLEVLKSDKGKAISLEDRVIAIEKYLGV